MVVSMNRDDIIRMAREVGLPHWYETEGVVNEELLIKFAALVAAAEREACAKLVDYWESRQGEHSDAIRARGEASIRRQA
jgi:hypothetical protein